MAGRARFFLLFNPASTTRPVPMRIMLATSGVCAAVPKEKLSISPTVPPPIEVPSTVRSIIEMGASATTPKKANVWGAKVGTVYVLPAATTEKLIPFGPTLKRLKPNAVTPGDNAT